MPLLQYAHTPSWNEAINQEGAVRSVLQSAAIVLVIATFLTIVAWRINKMKSRRPLTDKEQYVGVFTVCGVIIIAAFAFNRVGFAVPPAMIIILMLLILVLPKPQQVEEPVYVEIPRDPYLVYAGNNLRLTVPEIRTILEKHFPYFTLLSPFQKQDFIERTKRFYTEKEFIIHDTSGFREMPVLVSAAAVQLSFGLEKYLLPSFHSIHIYRGEFLSLSPSLHFVIGNVSNHCINVSWKHFLDGFTYPANGENVGLHEMAHAYYYQNFGTDADNDHEFCKHYKLFVQAEDNRLNQERTASQKVYSSYGTTNEQEFWAESAELFFEKPATLQTTYPDIYASICEVLNQDPLKPNSRRIRV